MNIINIEREVDFELGEVDAGLADLDFDIRRNI